MSSSGTGGSGRKLGRYHLVEPIGGGPTGEVFRAKVYGVAGFERQFAVKRFHPELVKAKQVGDAIARAARSYGNLEHPRIARMQEFGIAFGETFAAVEMVEGIDAAQLIQHTHGAGEPLQPGAALTVVKQVARAVGYAHGRGVLHLGLCPTNIVCGSDGDIKVTDFGFLSPRLPERPSDDMTLAARAPYLAPEQFVGEDPGPSTDVFQLGVVLYELMSGKKPFNGRTTLDISQAVLSSNFEDPPVPPEVLEILHRALTRISAERYPDGSALADAIEAAMRSAPLPGGPRDISIVVRAATGQRKKVGDEQVSGVFNFPMPAPPQSSSPLERALQQGTTPPPVPIVGSPRRTVLGIAPELPEFVSTDDSVGTQVDEDAPTKIRGASPPSANLGSAPAMMTDATPLPPPVPGSLDLESELAEMLGPQEGGGPPAPVPPPAPSRSAFLDLDPATGTVDQHIELEAMPPPELEGMAPPAKKKVSGGLLAVLALAVLGVGGFFGYQEFFAEGESKPVARPRQPKVVAKQPADAAPVVAAPAGDAGAVALAPGRPDAAAVAVAPRAPDAAPVPPVVDGSFEVRSKPKGATIYLDGTKVGRTPMTVEATGDSFQLALILPGHRLYTEDIQGKGAVDVTLEEVTPFNGRAGIKVRCKKKNRYYVIVDGEDTGMLCPTERIGVTLGEHVVEIYDPVTGSRNQFKAVVEETRHSLRVKVD